MLKIIPLLILTTVCSCYPLRLAIAKGVVEPIAMEEYQSVSSYQQISLEDNKLREILDSYDGNPQENVPKILILLGLVSGLGIMSWQLSRRGQLRKSQPMSRSLWGKTTSPNLINRVSPKLRRQLLRLINDPKTVNRLLLGSHQQHPERHPDWLAEKIIYDLRRGR